ncbi:MAG: hypothetical protein ACRC9T_09365 [Vibrionaceae bacterium]
MRSFIIIALVCFGLAGCAPQLQFGNFIEKPAVLDQELLASDTIKKIIELYPPGKTRFELQQPVPDLFGLALVRGLREHGYAVLEFSPEISRIAEHKPSANSKSYPLDRGHVPARTEPVTLPLHYVVDQLAGTELYRVSIKAGNNSLSRAYLQKSAGTAPAGSWAFKE